MEKSLKSIATNYGLYLGIALALLTVLSYAIDLSLMTNMWYGIFILLVVIIFGIISVAKTKQVQNIEYKFNEDEVLLQLKHYIDRTYSQHYSTDKIQATEFIIDSGHGEGFCMGNIIKYAKPACAQTIRHLNSLDCKYNS